MYKHITIYTLFLLLLIACSSSERGRMLAVLDEADSLNRNYIPFTTDSALKIAAEWFDSYGSANERMRAHYLLGCAYRDMGEAPAALQCYHDAVDCADTTATDCDYRLLSRVHGQMAALFLEQENPKYALLSIKDLESCALRSKDTLMYIIGYEQKANAYEALEKNDSIVAVEENVSKMYLERGDTTEASRALGASLRALVNNTILFPKYMHVFERYSGYFDEYGNIKHDYIIYYYYKGMYFLNINRVDSAEHYFRKLQKSLSIGDPNSREAVAKGLYLLYKSKNNNDSVAKYAEQAYNINDSVIKELSTTTIQRIESQYDYSRHQQIALEKSEEVSKFKSILFVVIFCVISVLYCTISIIRKYNRERREMEKQHKSDVQELLLLKNEIEKLSTANLPLIIEEKTKRIHELQSKIDEYQTKNYKKLNDVNLRLTKSEIYKHFRDYCLAPHKCEITVEDWDTLVGLLNNEVPTFFQLLTVNTQSLRKLDIYLCILVRLRFQPKDISIILDISQSEVSVLRRRLLKKIFNCDGSAKDFDKKIQSISD